MDNALRDGQQTSPLVGERELCAFLRSNKEDRTFHSSLLNPAGLRTARRNMHFRDAAEKLPH